MHKRKKYGELTFYLEACESGSMFDEHMPESLKSKYLLDKVVHLKY